MASEMTFTPAKLRALKLARDDAKRTGAETFSFENHEYLVRYANYLIEYLEGKFGDHAADR